MTDNLSAPCVLTARWIFPVLEPPLEGGTVTVQGDRIGAVEPKGKRTADLDLGNVALLPGLVNAHTHLDLSGPRQPIPFTGDFTAWLREVIAHRRSLTPEQVQDHIRAGLAESLSRGVTLLGDISGQGLSWSVLQEAPGRAVVFYEILGLPRERADQAWTMAVQWLRAHPATPACRPGLSPHAPYSVRASVFLAVAALAFQGHFPVATHLAETRIEEQLLQTHQGPFVDFLRQLGVWDEVGLVRDLAQVVELNRRVPHLLLAHGNYLDPALLQGRRATVVYCPRTHAYFGHEPHRFRELLALGTPVALGTDSRASNPDLDVLAEARFLHQRYPDVAGPDLLRMATWSGAEALGWEAETGSLTPGKSADLVVVLLPDDREEDPHRLVLASRLPVQRVMARGRWVLAD